jgi:hypothetical protein
VIHHCARTDCRTSLDEHPVTCPHGLPFCEHCTWEEACAGCSADAHAARTAEIAAAFASIPVAPLPPTRELEPPCRCGWPDEPPYGTPPVRVPVVDLTNETGPIAFESSPTGRTCSACTHPIPPGRASVVHRLTEGGGVYSRFHPECVEIR